jgi:4-hydroxybenzoate polyprenyltransferase
VFLPIVFVSKATDPVLLIKVIETFVALSFAGSAVYILNDIFDIEADRMHPKKKNRPIAKGDIPLNVAIFAFLGLLLSAFFIALAVNRYVAAIVVAYVAANFFYSKTIKHIAIWDIIFVSLFYLLRVYAGGAAIAVPISGWLLLTTFFISLFLIIGKRKAELSTAVNGGQYARKVLNDYNEQFLDSALIISLTLSIAFYALYSISSHNNLFALSIVFVLYGSLRYLYLLYSKGVGEEPEKMIFKDKNIFFASLLLGIYLIAVLYFNLAHYIPFL